MNEANLSKILGGIKYLPVSAGIKVLEKVHPIFKNYFSKVTAYGLDASKALDYLSSRFSNPNEFQKSLEARNPDQLRSDERIAKNEIEASKAPGKALRNAASLATGISLVPSEQLQEEQKPESVPNESQGPSFGPKTQSQEIAPRVQQLANKIREAPAQAKISPMNIANVASQAAQNVKSGLAKQALQGATGAANLIGQFPDLGKYLDDSIQQGNPPEQAALQAKSIKKFQSQIQAIENKVGQSFEQIIAQLFGKGNAQDPKQDKYSTLIQALQAVRQARGR